MNTITCQACSDRVVRGYAHIRSRSFVQVGWCRSCWAARRAAAAPAQRTYSPNVSPRFSRPVSRVIAEARALQAAEGVASLEQYANGARR